jgi:RNA polymerase sigma-70 factor, ECF subfamily
MRRRFFASVRLAFDAATDTPEKGPSLDDEITQIYLRHFSELTRYLRGRYGDEYAEELAQEAFVRLYEERAAGTQIENPRAWLVRVARNYAIDRLRRARRQVLIDWTELVSVADEQWAVSSPETLWLQREHERAVRDRGHLLSEDERRVLSWRAEGLTLVEIGTRLGIDFRRVAEMVSRAVQRLAAANK